MSRGNSGRRKAAHVRARYSEEPKWLAESSIRGKLDLGFDRCTDAQRQFRAATSLFLLNTDQLPQDVAESSAHEVVRQGSISHLLCYTMTFSPQYDEFVILSDMPDHIVQSAGIPGLRRNCVGEKQDSLLLTHVPTGARVRFCRWETDHPSHKRDLRVYPRHFNNLLDDAALTQKEQLALDAVPEMHPDSERLLAGLVSRLWLSSRQEGWAVPGLTWDALMRLYKPVGARPDLHFRYLWGSGTEWLLRWGGLASVPAVDVAQALTHRVVGIHGAEAVHHGANRSEVRYGQARLVLECHSGAPGQMQGGHR